MVLPRPMEIAPRIFAVEIFPKKNDSVAERRSVNRVVKSIEVGRRGGGGEAFSWPTLAADTSFLNIFGALGNHGTVTHKPFLQQSGDRPIARRIQLRWVA